MTTRKSSTTSSNNTGVKASAPATSTSQKNGEWLPDSRKSAYPQYSATPTLAANLNTTPKQIRTTAASASSRPINSPGSSSSSSSNSSNNNNIGTPPPRPPKDSLQYANLDHRAWQQDPRNRVLPGSASLPANTTYATVTTKEVTQTSSRTFGGNRKI